MSVANASGGIALSPSDQLNYELFRRDLQSDVDEHQFKSYLIPFSHRGGVQTLNQLTSRLRFTSVQDYEDWLLRMSKIDTVIEQTIERAERGRKDGFVAPVILMERIPAQIATQLVEVGADSPFYEKFGEMPATINQADLPHGTGKSIRILVFAKGDKEKEATEAGADYVGGE